MTNAEAIETLRANYPDACYEQLREAVDKAIKALEAQEWIPCSERLPKPYEYCLWTTIDGRVVYHHCDGLFSKYIAWMPLPEPYQAERWEK